MIAQTESNRAQDLWSCGVITYIMLCGYPPFFKNSEDKSEVKLLRQIVRGKYKFHDNFWSHISNDAKHFVSRLMCTDPRLRLTVEEALNHPWIVQHRSWNYRDSGLFILLKSLLIILFFCAILIMYFMVLSGFFDVHDHFLSRFCSLKDVVLGFYTSFETVCLSSFSKLSSLFSI